MSPWANTRTMTPEEEAQWESDLKADGLFQTNADTLVGIVYESLSTEWQTSGEIANKVRLARGATSNDKVRKCLSDLRYSGRAERQSVNGFRFQYRRPS